MKRRLLILLGVFVLVGALAGTALAGGRVWTTDSGFDDKVIATRYALIGFDEWNDPIYIDLTHLEGPSEDSY